VTKLLYGGGDGGNFFHLWRRLAERLAVARRQDFVEITSVWNAPPETPAAPAAIEKTAASSGCRR